MRGNPLPNPDFKIKKDKDKRAVRDDFYDRINYYESRNIFSSNEPFNPNNRLYTDHASLSHPVWNAIKQTNENLKEIKNEMSIDKKQDSSFDKELTQNLLSSINKLNTTSTSSSIGCKKCGYVGHLSYQCRNNFKLKNPQISKLDNCTISSSLLDQVKLTNEESTVKSLDKKKKKKHKKDKAKKKDKKNKNKRSRSRSRTDSKPRSLSRTREERDVKDDKNKINEKKDVIISNKYRSRSRSRSPRREKNMHYKIKERDSERNRNRSRSRSRSRNYYK